VILPDISIVPSHPRYTESYNAAVGRVARERRYLASVEPFTLGETAAFLAEVHRRNAVQFFAVDTTDAVVGWCDILPKQFEGMRHVGVLGMGVVEEFRGKGIGRRLLEQCIQAAPGCGITKVELEVYASNTRAIRMYERAGFGHEGLRKHARKLDGIEDDILLMGLMLEREH